MGWTGWVAFGLGIVILLFVAYLTPPVDRRVVVDPSMVWESRVAQGFGLVMFVGPFVLTQLGFTIAATVSGDGPWWLWLWLLCAPATGSTNMVRRVVRGILRVVLKPTG